MRLPILACIAIFLIVVAFATQADNTINGIPASDPLHVSVTTGTMVLSGTGTVRLTGTTETPAFPHYTTGTSTFAAGARSLQFFPSTSATGTIVMGGGTYNIPGAGNLAVISIPVRPGNTSTSGTVTLISGSMDGILPY